MFHNIELLCKCLSSVSVVHCAHTAAPFSTQIPDLALHNYNSSVTYSCNTGYYLASGNLTRTCLASGAWSGSLPNCSSNLSQMYIISLFLSLSLSLSLCVNSNLTCLEQQNYRWFYFSLPFLHVTKVDINVGHVVKLLIHQVLLYINMSS